MLWELLQLIAVKVSCTISANKEYAQSSLLDSVPVQTHTEDCGFLHLLLDYPPKSKPLLDSIPLYSGTLWFNYKLAPKLSESTPLPGPAQIPMAASHPTQLSYSSAIKLPLWCSCTWFGSAGPPSCTEAVRSRLLSD